MGPPSRPTTNTKNMTCRCVLDRFICAREAKRKTERKPDEGMERDDQYKDTSTRRDDHERQGRSECRSKRRFVSSRCRKREDKAEKSGTRRSESNKQNMRRPNERTNERNNEQASTTCHALLSKEWENIVFAACNGVTHSRQRHDSSARRQKNKVTLLTLCGLTPRSPSTKNLKTLARERGNA